MTKQPDLHKKPPNGYLLFARQVKAARSGENKADLRKEIEAMWSDMSKKEREPYKVEAKRLKEEYEKNNSKQATEALLQTEPTTPPEPSPMPEEQGVVVCSRMEKQPPEELKRPPNAYLLFARQTKAERLGEDKAELRKEIEVMWSEMSETEKEPFKMEAKRLKEEYEKKLFKQRTQTLQPKPTTPLEPIPMPAEKEVVDYNRIPEQHPKAPPSAYLVFAKCVKAERCAGENLKDLWKEIGAIWKGMSKKDKEPYEAESKRLKKEHEENLFKRPATPPQLPTLADLKEKPFKKRVPSGYNLFCQHIKLPEKTPINDISKEKGKRWNALSDEQRAQYCQEAERRKDTKFKKYIQSLKRSSPSKMTPEEMASSSSKKAREMASNADYYFGQNQQDHHHNEKENYHYYQPVLYENELEMIMSPAKPSDAPIPDDLADIIVDLRLEPGINLNDYLEVLKKKC